MEGTLLKGRYRITSLLGKGGQTRVYRAEDIHEGGRPLVVKELVLGGKTEKERSEEAHLFSMEAEILRTIESPHLPRAYDLFAEGDRTYIAEEFIEGSNLQDLMDASGGTIPQEKALEILRQSLDILAFLHGRTPPIIVRDIKPTNIIIDTGGTVYFVDFSIARRWEEGKPDTVRMGSPGYTPPEQFSGRSSPRSDLYACAATILHALTGYDPASTPFCFPDLRAGFPDLAPHWNRILGKAMKLKPQERFASAEAMSAALRPLERFLSDEFPWPWLRRMRSMLLRLFRRRAAVSSTGGAERP